MRQAHRSDQVFTQCERALFLLVTLICEVGGGQHRDRGFQVAMLSFVQSHHYTTVIHIIPLTKWNFYAGNFMILGS